MKIEELIGLLKKGESEEVEFKTSFTKDIAKDVCAFSNTVGGEIFIGIDDKGGVVGIKDENIEQKVSDILSSVHPHPSVKMERLGISDKEIFHINVSASDKLHSQGNIVHIRIGRNNRPLTTQEVIEKAAESAIVFFDELPSEAPQEAISLPLVKKYLEKRKEERGVKSMGSVEENLTRLKITKKVGSIMRPTNAGLLFFSESAQDYISNARVRIVWFESEEMERYTDSREFGGAICKMVDDLEDYFSKNLKVLGAGMAGWKRKEFMEYPMEALREAIINALIHRNYFDPSEVQIFIFPSKIVIKNPGSFPLGVTPDAPEHKPRNPLLAQYMYDMGYIEKYGSGINKIKEACRVHPIAGVEFILKPYRTEVVFKKEKEFKLDEVDQKILRILRKMESATSTEIGEEAGLSKVSVVKRMNALVIIGAIRKAGKGPATRYSVGGKG
ncbi:MAG: RNA-binding domain-containing protein [Candidatus Methanoperedens sp.]